MATYVVERDALVNNVRIIGTKAGKSTIWGVLKGDGYGLGVVQLAKCLKEHGILHYAITEVAEARKLREAGFIEEHILCMRPTARPEEVAQLLDLNVICSVSSHDDAVALNGIAAEKKMVAEAHVKIDTGMGRFGFLPKEVDKVISIYKYMENIAISGVYTHFHSAFLSEKKTEHQYEQFQYVIDQIEGQGYETGMVHCCNSASFLKYDGMHMSAVRIGSALLGRLSLRGDYGLQRVGHCEAAVEELKWLPKGHTTGYGGAWKAKKPTKVAVVGVGWYHGLGVEYGRDIFSAKSCFRGMLSLCKAMVTRKKLYVKIGGQKCPILGHVGMLQCTVDVTARDCVRGDTVLVELSPLLQRGMKVEYR